ncbi:MAG: TolC family outer membrane protein [Hyphomicrobiaceae bacterium]|nr:MAG: TolC family outer membrane protein [Hyphomicrobiaceae bacterium]
MRLAIGRQTGKAAKLAIILAAQVGLLTGAATAESLSEALVSAYMTNPVLDAQRASLRASDEEVPRARAGYRPTITGTADTALQHNNTKPPSVQDGELHPKGYQITMTQPVFRGFRVYNTVNVAEAAVRSARQQLRIVEQQTLQDAVTAYMDVVRDLAIVRVRENNVRVLNEQVRATQAQFAVGEVTRTDVAQAEARRAAAVSALDLARSNLQTSRATFERVIGHAPGALVDQQPVDRLLPRALQQAIEIGMTEAPSIVQAIYNEQAARHQIDLIRGELLPSAQIDTQYNHRYDTSRTVDQSESFSVTGRVTWQFWNGGEVEARIRQAKHNSVVRLQQVEQNRSQIQASVVQAWSSLQAFRAAVRSDQEQVQANQTALTGVREEYRVGQRTLLDVLNAEQELLNSQVQLITDRRNLVVASYALLQAMGRLEPTVLGLATQVYDPTLHYQEVKHKWFGSKVEMVDGKKDYSQESLKDNSSLPWKANVVRPEDEALIQRKAPSNWSTTSRPTK